ncbi:MAG TPA: membrane bound O-acyl transferase family-domain-containing protein, partial [Tepidisphaeraceae bacterium]|nr:membrane bound O-acyl transferase family-domain-containing protein [Tepidisphaeraceae bacterium]
RIPAARPMLLGWLGMFGMVLILHFGAFDLLALFWHSRGVNAVPLMRNPLGATSLADFWGRRWNTAFHRLTEQLVFKPLARLANARVAMMSGFVLSGLIHDLVISVPARGGFGLPTLYFVLQGAGVLVERSAAGRRAGLGTGVRGRAFAMLVAAGPAGLLFHPPFVMRVIVPFLRAIGATSHAR